VIDMCLGVPGAVLDIDPDERLPMGTVDFGGLRKEVCLAYVPDVQVGDYVIVHVGFAIALVDEAEAHRTLEVLRAMGEGALATELGVDVAELAR
jgi:hydrogenase assembly chaperone HypC/HupF